MLDPTQLDKGRRWLLHKVPEWIAPASAPFFVTVCCQRRGTKPTCLPGVGDAIMSAVRFYHEQRRWLLSLASSRLTMCTWSSVSGGSTRWERS